MLGSSLIEDYKCLILKKPNLHGTGYLDPEGQYEPVGQIDPIILSVGVGVVEPSMQ